MSWASARIDPQEWKKERKGDFRDREIVVPSLFLQSVGRLVTSIVREAVAPKEVLKRAGDISLPTPLSAVVTIHSWRNLRAPNGDEKEERREGA